MSTPPKNTFLDAPLGRTYVKTALPIIFVMSMSGLLAVVDALFLGHYVGAKALAAVTLIFPAYMLTVALATLVSSGMSSLLARHLGGHRLDEARAVFASAHGLALLVSVVLILMFLLFGRDIITMAAGGSDDIAQMALIYLQITVLVSPVMFVMSLNADALRNEGHVGFMAAMSLLVSLANIGFNYVLIALLDMGVAGSALGTALAQALALVIILLFRHSGRTILHPNALLQHRLTHGWNAILALGAPQSLNFIGLVLGSAATLTALQFVQSQTYDSTVSAYGIITRVLTFTYLPLLGLSHAMQTITGNNFGARQWQRTNDSLKIGVLAAFVYCLTVQILVTVFAQNIGQFFVDDPVVISEVARILPIIITVFFISGPVMMIAAYFQAIGDARRAAILSLTKPYLFALPLTFILAETIGEVGIWSSSPVAEVLLLIVTIALLAQTARRKSLGWGLFHNISKEVQ